MVSELSKWSNTKGRIVVVHEGEYSSPVGGYRRRRRNMVTVYCASSGQPGGRTCTHTVPATPVSLLTGSPRTLRMHRLVAALVALIESARRCGQVCTGYGVVARTVGERACSQSGPGAWSPVGELVSFGLAGTTDSSTPVPSAALPVQWRGI
jgi:hypothetical protein